MPTKVKTPVRKKERQAMSLTPNDLLALGRSIGQGMIEAQADRSRGVRPVMNIQKETSLTLGTVSIYGRTSIFDPCTSGDIFGLQVVTSGLMNWLGWRANRFYRRRVDFITWFGPAGTAAGSPSSGAVAPCDDPNGWEWGDCGYDLYHTSWYARAGDALDPHTILQDRCETTPRYRVNGTLIADDVEWQMNGIMNVLQQDIRRHLIHGSHTNANQMEGLESLIKTGYTDGNGVPCSSVDSILVDWDLDDVDGEVNGFGNFFNYLDEIVTEIEWRASAIGTIAETDMILLTSRFMATCLLDSYACYTTCGVTSSNDVTDQALRAQQRQARLDLNGGPLYDGTSAVGYIQLKSGRRLPIIVTDELDVMRHSAGYATDIYLLTRRIGSIDVLYGEYLDMREWASKIKKGDPGFRGKADATGRFAMKGKEDNFCIQLILGTSPEIYLAAPWAQVRISDVFCARERRPLVGDIFQPQYLPGSGVLHKSTSFG